MNETTDGGPAFPVADMPSAYPETLDAQRAMARGMTLRDYFAAKAMAAYIVADIEGAAGNADKAAVWAYENADAMLKARTQ